MNWFWKTAILVALVLSIAAALAALKTYRYAGDLDAWLTATGPIVAGQPTPFRTWLEHTNDELHELQDKVVANTSWFTSQPDHHETPPDPPEW